MSVYCSSVQCIHCVVYTLYIVSTCMLYTDNISRAAVISQLFHETRETYRQLFRQAKFDVAAALGDIILSEFLS